MFPVLETPRLVLRELRPDDAEDAFRFFSDEEAMRFYDAQVHTIDSVRELIPRHRQRFEAYQAIRWAITLKGEDRVIGTIRAMRTIFTRLMVVATLVLAGVGVSSRAGVGIQEATKHPAADSAAIHEHTLNTMPSP